MKQALHDWIVIDPLIQLYPLYYEGLDARVRPVQVPVRILIIIQLEVRPPARLLDSPILGLRSTKHELGRQFLLLALLQLTLVLWRLYHILHLLPVKDSLFNPELLNFFHYDFVCIVYNKNFFDFGFPFLIGLLLLRVLVHVLLTHQALALSLGCGIGSIVGRGWVDVGHGLLLLPLRWCSLRLAPTIPLRRTGTRVPDSRGIVTHLCLHLLKNGHLTHVFAIEIFIKLYFVIKLIQFCKTH